MLSPTIRLSHRPLLQTIHKTYIIRNIRVMSSSPSTIPRPTPERIQTIKENIAEIQEKVERAAKGRKARLVAVSKLKPGSDIVACLKAGQIHFGENYVQELEDKAKVLPAEIKWHFIGALQSNKCKALGSIPNLYAVETLDSRKKAAALQKARASLLSPRSVLNVFLQVNTSGESAKAGLSPPSTSAKESESDDDLVSLARFIRSEECPDLHLAGLMTIGSWEVSHSESEENADFRVLLQARKDLASALEIADVETLELSMGMSADFETALKMGSSNVRVGSSIFGERPSKEEAKAIREGEGFAGR